MTYEAIRYQGKVICIKLGDKYIPLDPSNSDYQEFLRWLAKGNTLDLGDQPYTPTQEEIDHAADLSDIKAQYQAGIDRLSQIISAPSATNAQLFAAVQDMAKIQLRVLKTFRWLI